MRSCSICVVVGLFFFLACVGRADPINKNLTLPRLSVLVGGNTYEDTASVAVMLFTRDSINLVTDHFSFSADNPRLWTFYVGVYGRVNYEEQVSPYHGEMNVSTGDFWLHETIDLYSYPYPDNHLVAWFRLHPSTLQSASIEYVENRDEDGGWVNFEVAVTVNGTVLPEPSCVGILFFLGRLLLQRR